MSVSLPVLVAIPDEWSSLVCEYLKQVGFQIVATHSPEETTNLLQESKDYCGIVIVSDWAMTVQEDGSSSLIKLVRGKIPTVTIITDTSRKQSGYLYMDEVFFPPSHEYVTAPFDRDELVVRMRQVGMA